MTLLYLNSDKLGNGPDEQLSKQLLLIFLEKLVLSEVKIDLIGCVNSAVFLTTKEGKGLELLKKMEEKGSRIASCKTCLDHFNLMDSLKIGETGTMDMTVMILDSADKVINPC
jgi:hypothetical protein